MINLNASIESGLFINASLDYPAELFIKEALDNKCSVLSLSLVSCVERPRKKVLESFVVILS